MSARESLFRTRPLAWLVGLALASGLVAILLLVFGEEIAPPASAGPTSYGTSAIGYRGAYELLRASGFPVVRSHDPRARALDAGSVLIVAEPVDAAAGELRSDALRALLHVARTKGCPAIVVLPKWRWQGSPENPAWVADVGRRRDADVAKVLEAMLPADATVTSGISHKADREGRSTWWARYAIEVAAPNLLKPSGELEPMLESGKGILVARLAGRDPAVLVVSDPDLAALLLDLLRQLPGVRSAVFDETIHGYEKRAQLLSWLLTFPALPVTIHLAVLGALAVWIGASRFGSPRRAEAALREGRERFVDTTARAMIGSGGEASSLGRYWSQTLDAIGDALHVPPAAAEARLHRIAALASREKVPEDPVALDREIEIAVRGGAKPERWAALASRIHTFRREMLHAPR